VSQVEPHIAELPRNLRARLAEENSPRPNCLCGCQTPLRGRQAKWASDSHRVLAYLKAKGARKAQDRLIRKLDTMKPKERQSVFLDVVKDMAGRGKL